MKKQEEWPAIRIEENHIVYPDDSQSYTGYYIFAGDECISELEYEELLLIRDLINRIERNRKQEAFSQKE